MRSDQDTRHRRMIPAMAIIPGILLLWVGFAQSAEETGILEAARLFIEGLGWEGMPLYVAFFIVGSLLFVSATALSAIAPILFGPWLGFIAILAGNMSAAAAMFSLARWAGVRWDRLRRFQHRLSEGPMRWARGNGLLLIFYARLVMLPASPVTYAAALLPVSFSEMFLGTLLGVLPHCLSTALSIGIVRDALLQKSWSALLRWELGLLAVTYAVTLWAVYHLRRRMGPRDETHAEAR